MAKTQSFHGREQGFNSWSGNQDPICHAAQPEKEKRKKKGMSDSGVNGAISLLMHCFQCTNLKTICSVLSGNWVEPVNDSTTWHMAGRKYMAANISTEVSTTEILYDVILHINLMLELLIRSL